MSQCKKPHSERNIFAEKHIKEAHEFSSLVGKADMEIKDFFFSLSPSQLDKIFTTYGITYGKAPEEYARKSYDKWRCGYVQMSGLIAKRLFALLPAYMCAEKKYQIARQIWMHSSPSSTLSFAIGPTTSIERINEKVLAHLNNHLQEHTIPASIAEQFKWLNENDVILYEKMLNYFRNEETEIAVRNIANLIPSIQREIGAKENTDALGIITFHTCPR